VEYAIRRAEACLDAGSRIVMMESEGITENVIDWRTDIIENFIGAHVWSGSCLKQQIHTCLSIM
jgi:phosphosulfolactate synthase (CoM biosynthesis protein A)